jgi:hypothetical protein
MPRIYTRILLSALLASALLPIRAAHGGDLDLGVDNRVKISVGNAASPQFNVTTALAPDQRRSLFQ